MPAPNPPRHQLHLGVSLDGAGSHPAAWREHDARPEDLFTGEYFVDLVQRAERGALRLRHRRRLVRAAAGATTACAAVSTRCSPSRRVAPLTRSIGLVPTVTTTHTEPFHVSKNVATLDYVSLGRAGWKVAVSTTEAEAAHFGRKDAAPPAELYAEAEEAVDVVVRLWDSWEDDAVIRDQPTGRYVDRDKLHYVDFEGRFFGVRGPSITPRPPQGHPIVAVGCQSTTRRCRRGARSPIWCSSTRSTPSRRSAVVARSASAARPPAATRRRRRVGRPSTSCSSATATRPRDRARLDALDGGETGTSGALDFVGTPAELADAARRLVPRGGPSTGSRLRPAVLPLDLGLARRRRRARAARARLFRTAYDGAHAARPLRPDPAAEPLRRGAPHPTQADPPRRALPRRQQHDGLERPDLGQPDRLRVVRAPGAHGRARASSTSSSSPRGCACASTAAASSTSTSSAGPTRSPCWPRSRPSPTGSASRPRSTPRSTSPTSWPASSPPSTTSAAVAPRGTR